MAETAALKFLLKSCGDLIGERADNELEKEIGLLKGFLEKRLSMENEEQLMYIGMERQMREVIYDAVDSYLTEAQAATKRRKFYSFGSVDRLAGLAEQVKSLREDKVKPMVHKAKMAFADVVTGRRSQAIVAQPPPKGQQVQRSRQYQIVGFENEAREIISFLMEPNDDELDVISIVGMPGQGKTTLTWGIYQNMQIRNIFPIRIWVHVSHPVLNKRDVCVNILKQFTDENMSGSSDQYLAMTVRSFLENSTKFVLVIDNVWSVDTWYFIKDLLPNNGVGKVIITTRFMNVGLCASRTRRPHLMRLLTVTESWKLLRLEIFGASNACPFGELTRIGESVDRRISSEPTIDHKTVGCDCKRVD